MSKKNNIPSWDDTDMIEDIPSFEDTEDLAQKKKEEPAWSGVPDVLQPQEVTQPENYVEKQAEPPKTAKNKAIPVAERYARYKGEKLQKSFAILDEPQNRELFERGMAGDQQAMAEWEQKRSNIATKQEDNIAQATSMLLEKSKETTELISELPERTLVGRTLKGIGAGVSDYISGYVDFWRNISNNRAITDLNDKLERINKFGIETLTNDEVFLLEAINDNVDKVKQLEASDPEAYNVGSIIGNSLGFMGEFLITGGFGKGAAAAVRGIGGATRIGQLSAGLGAKLAQSGIQAAAMPSTYKATAEKVSNGEDFVPALLDSYYETTAETLSERLFMGKAGTGEAVGKVDKFLRSVGSGLADKKGTLGILKGVGEEYLEEKANEIMLAPKDQESFKSFWQDFTDLDKNKQTISAVGLMGGVLGSPKIMDDVSAIRSNIQRKSIERNVNPDIKKDIDEIVANDNITAQEAVGLVQEMITSRLNDNSITGDINKTVADAVKYTAQAISDKQSKVDPTKATEVPPPTVGEVEEGDTQAQQQKIDYLVERGVEVPDGTTMEQLDALYNENIQKETIYPEPIKPIEQMTSEEIRSFAEEIKRYEKNIYSVVFGEQADKFRRLEQSSNNPTKSREQLKSIDLEMQQMIDALPKQKRDILESEAKYDAIELRDMSRMVGLVEESENASELVSSLKNPLMTFSENTKNKQTLAVFNAATKKAQELGISTEDLITRTSKLIAKEFKDPKDALYVVKSALESISKPTAYEQRQIKPKEAQTSPAEAVSPPEAQIVSPEQKEGSKQTKELTADDIEAKKADIEKKRQEEIYSYKKLDYSLKNNIERLIGEHVDVTVKENNYGIKIFIKNDSGKNIFTVTFNKINGNTYEPGILETNENYRRKGIASKVYETANNYLNANDKGLIKSKETNFVTIKDGINIKNAGSMWGAMVNKGIARKEGDSYEMIYTVNAKYDAELAALEQQQIPDVKEEVQGQAAEEVAPTKEAFESAFTRNIKEADDWLAGLENQLNQFGKETLGVNIPVVVAQGAIKTARGVLQTAKTASEAVNAAIEYVRNTDWYKSLSEKDKADTDNKIKSLFDKGGIQNAQGDGTRLKEGGEQAQGVVEGEEGRIRLRDYEKTRAETGGGERVRQRGFSETVKKAGDEFIELSERNPSTYTQRSNKAGIQEAIAWLADKDESTAHITLKKRFRNASPERQERRMVFMHYLTKELNSAAKENNTDRVDAIMQMRDDIFNALNEEATVGGQASSAIQSWYALDPDVAAFIVKRQIAKENNKRANNADVSGLLDSVDELNDAKKEIDSKIESDSRLDDIVKKLTDAYANKKTQGTSNAKAKQIADAVRKAKPSNWGLTFAGDPITSVGIGILDGALETTAKAIEITGDIANSIKIGIEKIKESDWYKGLTKSQQKKAENAFSSNVNSALRINKEINEIVKKGIKEEVSDMGKTIRAAIKEHLSDINGLEITLAERISARAGIKGKEAKQIEAIVRSIIRENITESVVQRVSNAYIPKQGAQRTTFMDKLTEVFLAGGFDNKNIRKYFTNKFGLMEDISSEDVSRIIELHKGVTELSGKGVYGDIVAEVLLHELDKYVPRSKTESILNVMIAGGYSNMLYGPTSHRVNILSVMSNAMIKPASKLFDMDGWGDFIKAIRSGDVNKMVSTMPMYRMIQDYVYFIEALPIAINQITDTLRSGDIRSLNKYVSEATQLTKLSVPELERRVHGTQRFKGKYNPANLWKYSLRALGGVDAGITKMFEARILAEKLRDELSKKGYSEAQILTEIQRQVFGLFLTKTETDAIEAQIQEEKAQVESMGIPTDKKLSPIGEKIVSLLNKTHASKFTGIKANKRRLELIREKISAVEEQDLMDITEAAKYNVFNDNGGGITSAVMNNIGAWTNKNIARKLLVGMPFFAFTKVFGRIGNYMLNTAPFYATARTYGYGATSMYAHAIAYKDMGDPAIKAMLKGIAGKRLDPSYLPNKTSMLGREGSVLFEEQRRQALLGNVLFLPVIAMVAGMLSADPDDEDDFFMVSGGRLDLKNEKDRENPALNDGYPPYTVKIGKFKFRYQNHPLIALPLSIMGNYIDMKREGYSEKEIEDRLAIMTFAVLQSIRTITENQLAGGFKDLSEAIGRFLGMRQTIKNDPDAEKLSTRRAIYDFGEYLLRKEATGFTQWIPTKNNAIQQTLQYFYKEGKESKNIPAILAYNVGIHHFTNKPELDLFGKVVYKLPGYTQILYDPILKEKDPERWKMFRFLSDNDAVPAPYFNRTETFYLKEPLEFKNKDAINFTLEESPVLYGTYMPSENDFWELRKEAGNKFYDKIKKYESKTDVWQKEATIITSSMGRGDKTVLQNKVAKYWNESKEQARLYLYTWADFKTKENKKIIDDLYEKDLLPKPKTTVSVFDKDTFGDYYQDENGKYIVIKERALRVAEIATYNSIVFNEFLNNLKKYNITDNTSDSYDIIVRDIWDSTNKQLSIEFNNLFPDYYKK